jgi:hypothetical protein
MLGKRSNNDGEAAKSQKGKGERAKGKEKRQRGNGKEATRKSPEGNEEADKGRSAEENPQGKQRTRAQKTHEIDPQRTTMKLQKEANRNGRAGETANARMRVDTPGRSTRGAFSWLRSTIKGVLLVGKEEGGGLLLAPKHY